MSYYDNLVFPKNAKGVLDVTAAPYFLDPTGKEDCTEKLRTILNDLMRPMVTEMKALYQKLLDAPGDIVLSVENLKIGKKIKAIMPIVISQIPMIYFPNGTYLVSDTISYTIRDLHNMMYRFTPGGFELNRCIRLIGQSREKTIIKLTDHNPAFSFGQERSVFNFMPAERSNVSMSNYLENMTIDVGRGNPGAVGITFFANNSGAIRNVTIRSSDEAHEGAIGILVRGEHLSACNVYDVEIDGFTYGVMIANFLTCSHFERITLRNQRKFGFKIENNAVQIIGLEAHVDVPAVFMAGPMCHVVVTNANIVSQKGSIFGAMKYERGCVYLRDIHTRGFAAAYEETWFAKILSDGYIKEYCNRDTFSLFDDKAEGIGMEVAALPDIPDADDLNRWCCVNDYGAVGDGVTDDTQAIENAMASGNRLVWFQPGHYLITRPVVIPATVEHVHFMFCDICAGQQLRDGVGEAVFLIQGESPKPLFIEKLFAWNECIGRLRMFRQDSARTLYMRDVHTQACATYFNTVPGGEVFLENVACTVGKKDEFGDIPCFEFNGQTVWCHAINPERSVIKVVNRGGRLWWSGFKTEQVGPITLTEEGGVTEILGGVTVSGTGEPHPLIDNRDSDVSAIFSTAGINPRSVYPIAVREQRGEQTREIYDHQLPQRYQPWYFMPLYSGRGKKK